MTSTSLHRVKVVTALLGAALCSDAHALTPGEICGVDDAAPCAPSLTLGAAQLPPDVSAATQLTFYWGVGCPHCEEASPFLEALEREQPALRVTRLEVRRDAAGRERFLSEVARLRIAAPGVPLFVAGDRYVLGFSRGTTESAVRELVHAPAALAEDGLGSASDVVVLPLVGRVESRRVPLAAFTAAVGLLDGLNPCAMWVLIVMLGVLSNVRARGRLLLFGATFVFVSGLMYFAFMTAWAGVFAALGGSRRVTVVLGIALLLMGIVNAKEVFLFRRGVSLSIPEKAKPALYRRMREVVHASSLPAALLGVTALALLANLVELGCTLGLPAMYTRVLSLRTELEAWHRIAWIAAYNLFYVTPLAIIVVVWVAVAPRARLGDRGARILKGVSGVLLIAAGIVLLVAPELLA